MVALVAFLGACHAAEHAVSSQSIVRYDDHRHNHEVNTAVPVLKKVIRLNKINIPIKAVPVAHYVSESSGLGKYGSESLGLSAYGGRYETESSSYGHGVHYSQTS